MRRSSTTRGAAIVAVATLALAACSNGSPDPAPTGGATGGTTEAPGGGTTDPTTPSEETDAPEGEAVTLSLAHSYATNHPHHTCGAVLVQEQVAEANVGLEIEIFPDSSLGGHADRFALVVSGDIDIDIQGPSEMSSTYAPVGILDAAYAFDGPDHLFGFYDTEVGEELKANILDATGARVLTPWYFGMRHFTANVPLNTPEDFQGLRMRFPNTPQYLQNAEALGASPVAVAFEELYISLQQGVVDGQENPIPNIATMNLPEVQSHLSLTGHMVGIHMIVMNEDRWSSLSADQQETLQTVFEDVRDQNRECIEQSETETVEQWRAEGTMEVIEPDLASFRESAEEFFTNELEGDTLELYQAIRDQAS
ncbi:MAG: DctP family TRAP transporter solute-binding subunit [bacterium]|nr:DctP family TRAP transporter solute-binding subunit [bacterium]